MVSVAFKYNCTCPKQQRRPLPSLLSLSFFYGFNQPITLLINIQKFFLRQRPSKNGLKAEGGRRKAYFKLLWTSPFRKKKIQICTIFKNIFLIFHCSFQIRIQILTNQFRGIRIAKSHCPGSWIRPCFENFRYTNDTKYDQTKFLVRSKNFSSDCQCRNNSYFIKNHI